MNEMGSFYTKWNRRINREFGIIVLILALPFLVLLPFDQLLFPINSVYSDLVIAHLPPILDIRFTLEHTSRIPLWSNSILSGYPLISDPLSGIWYAPMWLTWFFPLPASVNLVVVAHLLLLELGMFFFLKKQNLHTLAAITGALMAGLAPKVIGQLAGGHITLIMAFAWTPWLLFFYDADEKVSINNLGISALVLGFMILADIRWAAYGGLLYAVYSFVEQFKKRFSSGWKKTLLCWIKNIGLQVCGALIIDLPYLWLLAQYTGLSTRSMMTLDDRLVLSLPPQALLGIV
ncbi:MAG: hypothetical protein LWX83_19010, partial [Anaerolineae bacterium]|nr:hypothetical protein [Anaerolineae bacterium]